MNKALAVLLLVGVASCHEGAPHGADEWEIDHPLTGAWTDPTRPGPVLYFHRSLVLDEGDLDIFPGVWSSWSSPAGDSPILVHNLAGENLAVNVDFTSRDEVVLSWDGRSVPLSRTKYLVVDDNK